MHRVQKLLSNYGYCSRRNAEKLIDEGRVKVNGKTISLGDKAEETDTISVDNKPVKKQKKLYLVFHKPVRCVTALTDDHRTTIMKYINLQERVFPIGRLDYLTSGLLLLTNDGDFANKIMHPRYEIKKTYRVTTLEPIHNESINKLKQGILLEDGKTAPAKVVKIKSNVIDITIHEGKNRIVRRMIKKLGYKMKTLERTRIGHFSLNNLELGKYRELTEEEKKKIFF